MANSFNCIMACSPSGLALFPDRTCGALGFNDQSDPNITSLLGDTPGSLGLNDGADPSVLMFGSPHCGCHFNDRRIAISPTIADRGFTYTPPLKLSFPYFYDYYSTELPPFGKLLDDRKSALQELLAMLCADENISDIRWLAYMLATVLHESRSAKYMWLIRWLPEEESGGEAMDYGKDDVVQGWNGIPLDTDGNPLTAVKADASKTIVINGKHYLKSALVYKKYFGRGFVQITHQDNYRAMDNALGLENKLLTDPELALNVDVAYKIMSYGMREGSFRGVRSRNSAQGYFGGYKLSDFIGGTADYEKARNIINGDIKKNGKTIAGYAENFEFFIQKSRLD